MSLIQKVLMGIVIIQLSSCVSASVVSSKPGEGGVVAVGRDSLFVKGEESRAKANMLMKQNCGDKNPKIIEEGLVVVGQRTRNRSRTKATVKKRRTGFTTARATGRSSTRGSSTTKNITQWQLQYKCE